MLNLMLYALVFVCFAILMGPLIAIGHGLVIGIFFGSLYGAKAIETRLFRDIPVKIACSWPKDRRADALRIYSNGLIKGLTIFFAASLIFLICLAFLKAGLGDQWNPLTRDIHLRSGHPYFHFSMYLVMSGGVALVSGIWLVFYGCFEWMTLPQNPKSKGATHA